MKNLLLGLSLLLTFSHSNNTQNLNKIKSTELLERADFYHVNTRYELASDTMFYSTSGFKVFPESALHKIGTESFYILQYPNFKDTAANNGTQTLNNNTLNLAAIKKSAVHIPISGLNGRILMIEKSKYDSLRKRTVYKTCGFPELSTGILSVPFKLRPKLNNKEMSISTDATIGTFIGPTIRISSTRPYYLTLPLVAGISYINTQIPQ